MNHRWLAWCALLFVACSPGSTDPDTRDASSPRDSAPGPCTADVECDDGDFCNGEEQCTAGVCVPGDEPCARGQDCDPAAARCVTDCASSTDADGDGSEALECGGDDCDDGDDDVHPGASELCDSEGVDEDCDPTTYGARDLDRDGRDDAACCNGARCGDDCDDLSGSSAPRAAEACNGRDDDCDGMVDEEVRVDVWPDRDRDGHGDAHAEASLGCAGTTGLATTHDDCDDTDRRTHPGRVELCDTRDNDCDAEIDETPQAVTWYVDADADGFGAPGTEGTRISCAPIPGFSDEATDCDDTAPARSPGAPERCNGLDDDCNGLPDFLLGPGDTEDDDLDQFADARCESGDDCDDRDASAYPGAVEICDRRDSDCDDEVDEESAIRIWLPDTDGDGFGDMAGAPLMSCAPIAGYVTRGGDCDDSSVTAHPSAPELCNEDDDDCDAATDEGIAVSAYYLDSDRDGLGAGAPVLACGAVRGRVANASDCDDTRASVGAPSMWSPDDDSDGFGDGSLAPVLACSAPARHVANRRDCDDDDAAINPAGTEGCDGVDEDCDGEVDDGADGSCAIPHSTAMCVAGECAIASCSPGWADCDLGSANGCELPVTDDVANCGGCGVVCESGERCRFGSCAALLTLVAGRRHVCALLSSGEVTCWGDNTAAQMGRDTLGGAPRPGRVLYYTGEPLSDVVAISAHPAGDHTCAVRASGDVVCWGQNGQSQCGGDAPPVAARAYPVPTLSTAVAVDVGVEHSCAVLSSGGVRCWGSNTHGRLGNGSTTADRVGTPVAMVEIEGGSTREIRDAAVIGLTQFATCVVHNGGRRMSCAGRANNGELGRSSTSSGDQGVADDAVLPEGAVLREIEGGWAHFCARAETGSPLCWGNNSYGQLGTLPSGTSPRPLDTLLLASTSGVATGAYHTCASYTNPAFGARVACVGYDPYGALGDGVTQMPATDSTLSDVVTNTDASTFLSRPRVLAMGEYFGCAVLESGSVSCWGHNGGEPYGVSGPDRAYCDLARTVPGVP